MEKKREIRILSFATPRSRRHAAFVGDNLRAQAVALEVEVLGKEGDASGGTADFQRMAAALLRGDADIGVCELDQAPIDLSEELSITALSERTDPSFQLLVSTSTIDRKKTLRMTEGAEVGVSTLLQKSLLAEFRPDLRYREIPGAVVSDSIAALQRGEMDALLLPAGHLAGEEELPGVERLPLHPREFVPPPGCGTLAFLACRDDLETRRLLKGFHHPEASERTNIERKVLKLAGADKAGALGAYCEKDQLGNYHLWAALAREAQPLQRVRLSSSTRLGLAEQVWAELEKR